MKNEQINWSIIVLMFIFFFAFVAQLRHELKSQEKELSRTYNESYICKWNCKNIIPQTVTDKVIAVYENNTCSCEVWK